MLRLAQNLLSKICIKPIRFLRKHFHFHKFLQPHSFSEKYFSHNRKVSFTAVLFFLMHLVHCSLQREIDEFFSFLDLPIAPKERSRLVYLSSMKNNIVHLFTRRPISKILQAISILLSKSLSIIRPSRKNPGKRECTNQHVRSGPRTKKTPTEITRSGDFPVSSSEPQSHLPPRRFALSPFGQVF